MVIGAGAGGLTAALALRQAGIETTVFEQAQEPLKVGAGLHVWTNALLSLQRIGLAADLASAGIVLERSRFMTHRGKVLADWPTGAWGRSYGAPTIGVRRPALAEVLRFSLGSEPLRFGMRCTGFEQDADGVEARFEDGQVERSDLLIGADGLMSTIRGRLLGDAPPRYSGTSGWRAVIDWPDEDQGTFKIMVGLGHRIITYPVAPGKLYFLCMLSVPAGGRDEPGQSRALLRERFAQFADPVAAILDSTPDEAISRADIVDRPPVKRWGEGRVTLLGDAAHPMTPNLAMGACTAIEDGVVLADRLSGAGGDVAGALRAYEHERMPRTARLTKQSYMIGQSSHRGGPRLDLARHLALRFGLNTFGARNMKRDMGFAPEAPA
jgi:2-polyprenyl-6-methoxyphenol hydroxylase-like FAD-dependent oxidoreductase